MPVVFRYTLFAVIATVANIGSQAGAVALLTAVWGSQWAIIVSVLVGTIVGVIVKYFLDKKWIFSFEAKSVAHQAKAFSFYTLFSVGTTLIFWGFEFGAQLIFGTEFARYSGGVIGLAVGYVVKYHLDKRITFADRPIMQQRGAE